MHNEYNGWWLTDERREGVHIARAARGSFFVERSGANAADARRNVRAYVNQHFPNTRTPAWY